MSVIGLSPSDFVSFIRVVLQSVQALKEGDGSKERFQDTSRNNQLRIDVLQDLNDFAISQGAGSFSNSVRAAVDSLRDAVERVLEQDRKAKAKLDKYNSTLGQHAPRGRRRGVLAKWQWAFDGAQDQTERNARSVPSVDAALLRSILLGAETSRQRDDDLLASLASAKASIASQALIHASETTKRITDMESKTQAYINSSIAHIQCQTQLCADQISADLANAENRNRAHLDHNKADILSEIDLFKKELTSLATKLFKGLHTTLHNQDAQRRAFEQKLETILNSRAPLNETKSLPDFIERALENSFPSASLAQNSGTRPARSRNDAQKRAVHSKSRERQLTKFLPDIRNDVVKGSVLTISCVLYGHPSMKKAARALVAQISCDPILALLVVFAGYFFTRHFSSFSIPLSIGSQHSLRSSDPFPTWPRTDYRKLLSNLSSKPAYQATGTIYMCSAAYGEVVVKIGWTSRDVHSRMKARSKQCATKCEMDFSLARIQEVRMIKSVLRHELQSSQTTKICARWTTKICARCKNRPHKFFKVDVQIAVKVVSQMLDWWGL